MNNMSDMRVKLTSHISSKATTKTNEKHKNLSMSFRKLN